VDTYTIWVCQVCMLHHANGECGDCYAEEGHDREPFGLWEDEKITMGLLDVKHYCGVSDWCGSYIECTCATDPYSTLSCQGCGSTFHGTRHAFTVWES